MTEKEMRDLFWRIRSISSWGDNSEVRELAECLAQIMKYLIEERERATDE